MKVVLACPHAKISGGTKVILTVADGLAKVGIDTTVAFLKINDPLLWFNGGKYSFNVVEANPFSKYTLPESDILLNFLDGEIYTTLNTKKHVLFFQGFGTQNRQLEIQNLLYKYDAVIATTSWLADLAKRAGHQQIYIIPPGIDSIFQQKEKPRDGIIRIGSLYHSSPDKNFALFVNAFNRFTKTYKKSKACIVSANVPADKSLFDLIVTSYSLYVKPEMSILPNIYSICDAWVAPSASEGFGLCPLEAMACGTPTVIVKSFGLDDFVLHNNNCMYVNPDKEAISSALVALIGDGSTKTRIIKNGLLLSSKFTWKDCIDQFVLVLKDILK